MDVGLQVLSTEAYLALTVEQAVRRSLVLLVCVLSDVRGLLELSNYSATGLRPSKVTSRYSLVLFKASLPHTHATHTHLLDSANLTASTSQEALICASRTVVVVSIIKACGSLGALVCTAHD